MKTLLAAGAALAFAACGGDEPRVSLAVAISGTNSNALSSAITATPGPSGMTLVDGTNTLIITRADVVLREIELKRDDVTACPSVLAEQAEANGDDSSEQSSDTDLSIDDASGDDISDDDGSNDDEEEDDSDDERDGCEEFETGPRVISLPLDGSVSEQVIAAVPEGTYDRLEFEIHKLDDDDGSSILRDRPELADLSVRIVGTFNGEPFVFASDDSFEQRVELNPPLVVNAGDTEVNVTLSIDLAKWFSTDGGMLIDPNSADDEALEDAVADTFACFEDDDRDGDDDRDDADEDDSDASDDDGEGDARDDGENSGSSQP